MLLRLLAAGRGAALGRRTMTMLVPSSRRLDQIKTMNEMNKYFPKVVEQLKEVADELCEIADETLWLEKVLYHNIPGGKMVRALTCYYGILELQDKNDPKVKEKALNIAWTQEMIQAAVLIADDISDEGVKRRGKVSWHALTGKDAVFDVLLVENCAQALLARHCDGMELLRTQQLFSLMMFSVSMGQNRDNHCKDTTDGRSLFEDFTMERYIATCEHKSGGYTFSLPVCTALNVSGVFKEEIHAAARDISSDLGLLYQGQDDYLDAYGVISHMGKDRTDVRNGKGSWVITAALQEANSEQRQKLKDNYGINDQAKVDTVMRIYEELNMKGVFIRWESELIKKIEGKIQNYSNLIPPEIFTHALETVLYHVNR